MTRAGLCKSLGYGACTLALTSLISGVANSAEGDESAFSALEEIVVTAQRRAQSLQEVPIAVSAFSDTALDERQIRSFSDLQFATPNVSFSRGNFTASNFQIRGVGSAEISSSGDAAVGFHVNDAYLNAPRLADTEFYDIQRIEVLRGPQGTLYGRNSTGGAVNVITAKADVETRYGRVDVQYGNFDHIRLDGMVNVPLSDKAAIRVSGVWLKRDGYTENVNPDADFSDIDGRDQWSGRISLRLLPSDRTTIDVLYQHFQADDTRTRSNKQLCDFDSSAILGCLPTGVGTDTTNFDATLGRLFISDLVLTDGLNVTNFGAGQPGINPAGLRDVFVDFEPSYKADEDFFSIHLAQDIGDELTFNMLGSYHRSSTVSKQGFTNAVGETISVPAAMEVMMPQTFAAFYSEGCFPISDKDDFGTGIIGGFIRDCINQIQHLDDSRERAKQYGFEARLNSSFDGPINFLIAGNYMNYEHSQDYSIFNNTVDYFALAYPGVLLSQGPDAPSAGDGLAALTPWFRIQTDQYKLESWALFGELYVDLRPDLRLTVGGRFTRDSKEIRDRQYPLFTGGIAAIAGFDPATAEDIWLASGYDADLLRPGQQLFREATQRTNSGTGRIVLDYSPELSFTDSTLIYGSYSRGYRGGGFNPAFDPAEFPETSTTFDSEHIDAFEIGTKNILMGDRLQANLSGFFYDYNGLQIAKTVNRALINENIDAEIWGVEAEFVYKPTPRWQLDVNLARLGSRIKGGGSVDTRDPTAGRLDSTLIKSFANTENCVINWNGNPDPMQTPPAFLIPSPGGPTLGIASGSAAFSAIGCGANLQNALDAVFGPEAYTATDGNEASLSGNSLRSAPKHTASIGLQYAMPVGRGMDLQFRGDYYWQSDMWTRIFNRPETDRVSSHSVVNMQVTLMNVSSGWYVRTFVRNLADKDVVTGHYLNAPSSGLFTNAFLIEPRIYGMQVGTDF